MLFMEAEIALKQNARIKESQRYKDEDKEWCYRSTKSTYKNELIGNPGSSDTVPPGSKGCFAGKRDGDTADSEGQERQVYGSECEVFQLVRFGGILRAEAEVLCIPFGL